MGWAQNIGMIALCALIAGIGLLVVQDYRDTRNHQRRMNRMKQQIEED